MLSVHMTKGVVVNIKNNVRRRKKSVLKCYGEKMCTSLLAKNFICNLLSGYFILQQVFFNTFTV